MGQRPGFVVSRHYNSSTTATVNQANDVTVELRVFGPGNSNAARIKELLSSAYAEAVGEVERVWGTDGQ